MNPYPFLGRPIAAKTLSAVFRSGCDGMLGLGRSRVAGLEKFER